MAFGKKNSSKKTKQVKETKTPKAKKAQKPVIDADKMAKEHSFSGNSYQQYYRDLIGQKK